MKRQHYELIRVLISFALALILTLILTLIIVGVLSLDAKACTADVSKVNNWVYVRDDDGNVKGCLKKGDRVIVIGRDGGWKRVCIGGTEYNVWGEYLEPTGESADDVEVMTKVRKSKSMTPDENGVMNKKEYRIDRDSPFSNW